MAAEIDAYLERFEKFGAKPSVERYLDLFHPEGTLFDSGMDRPLTVPEIPEHIGIVLRAAPDFRFEIAAWRARGETLFVEAANAATIGGEKLAWDSVYCITLKGDRVIRGRRYYDRMPLLSRLDPSLMPLPRYETVRNEPLAPAAARSVEAFVDDYTELWQAPEPRRFADFYAAGGTILNPGMDRAIERAEIPGYYAFLLAMAPDLRMERIAWAGDDALLFVEWRGAGTIGGSPVTLPVVDRWSLDGGLATEGRAYFDSVALSRALSAANA